MSKSLPDFFPHMGEQRMTDIYIELAGKKAIAWSLDWPGWCRIRAREAAAVQALIETEARYRLIAERTWIDFTPGDLVVVERLTGDANTAWGVPSVLASAESRPLDTATAQRNVALLRASWDMLEEVVATSPAELRKRPRGGGRDWLRAIGRICHSFLSKSCSQTEMIPLSTSTQQLTFLLSLLHNGDQGPDDSVISRSDILCLEALF